MSEIYTGVKFKFWKLGELIISEEISKEAQIVSELLVFLLEECCPETSGNVSIKTKEGMLISSSGTILRKLSFPFDFCEVVSSSQENRIRFFGSGIPSSESRMHLLAYDKRPEAKYCLHVHLPNTGKLQILDRYAVTSKFLSYGTIDLSKEASDLLKSSNIVILRDHGVVVLGEDFKSMVDEVRKISKM